MNLKKGTSLQNGRYRIESVLGQGGFGITYLAVQTDLDCKVAVKEFFMKDFCNRDADTSQVSVPSVGSKELVEKFKSKFIREAKSIASFHHPSIVRVSAVFEENGTAYYVMDYLEGGSLSDLVGRTGLPERQALFYIRQIAEALGYVHSRNMLHLDLKPGNIMLDDDGRAVLIDFGVSKQYDEVSGENTSTLLGYTPGYAPPEQMDRDVKAFFPATDIYSLGAILYNLLTGIAPLSATRRISGEELAPLPAGVSPSVRMAIDEAMQFNKSKRPQTVADFLALLDAPTTEVSRQEKTEMEHNQNEETELGDIDAVTHEDKGGDGEFVSMFAAEEKTPVSKRIKWILVVLCLLLAIAGIAFGLSALLVGGETEGPSPVVVSDSDSVQVAVQEDTPVQSETDRMAEQQAESLRIAEERRQAEEAELARQEEQRRAEEEERRRQEEEHQAEERRQAEEAERKRQEVESVPRTVTAVDLGLSVKWADRNVGADSPEDYGDYFAWGETQPKSTYDWSTYKWCNGDWKKLTKYCTKSDRGYNGFTDGKITLDLSDDAAYVNMGSNWRMPTKSELEELKNGCTWTWTTRNSKEGFKVTGPNGNSIFLPAAGCRDYSKLSLAGSDGYVWSSSLYEDGPNSAYPLYFGSNGQYTYYLERYRGQTVRAVVR